MCSVRSYSEELSVLKMWLNKESPSLTQGVMEDQGKKEGSHWHLMNVTLGKKSFELAHQTCHASLLGKELNIAPNLICC